MPIYSNAHRNVWTTWLTTVLWNGPVWLAIVKGHDAFLQLAEARPIFLVFTLFPLIGLFIIYSAIRATLVWLRFGRTALFPDNSGQGVAGHIQLPNTIGKASPAKLSLTCYRNYIEKTTDGSEFRKEVLWQDECTITPKLNGSTHRVDFRFRPPGHLPVSGKQALDSFRWELRLHIPLPGIDCETNFELPVVAAMLDNSDAIEFPDRSKTVENTSDSMPTIANIPDGLRFHYPAGRAKGSAIAFILIGVFFGGFGFLMFEGMQNFLVVTSRLILGMMLLIGLILFLFGLCLVGNTLTVEVGLNGIRKNLRFFGYQFTEQVKAADIIDIQAQTNGSAS